jgi:hypothetical protein
MAASMSKPSAHLRNVDDRILRSSFLRAFGGRGLRVQS